MRFIRDYSANRVVELTGAMVKALAISAQGPDAPAFRVRTRIPAAALASHGVELVHAPLFSAAAAAAFATGDVLSRSRLVVSSRR